MKSGHERNLVGIVSTDSGPQLSNYIIYMYDGMSHHSSEKDRNIMTLHVLHIYIMNFIWKMKRSDFPQAEQ